MPGPGFGPCEVCGVETNKRCSACVQVSIELFFCSSEHQKLVSRERRTLWARAATGLTDTASLRPAGLESSQDLVRTRYFDQPQTLRSSAFEQGRDGQRQPALHEAVHHSIRDDNSAKRLDLAVRFASNRMSTVFYRCGSSTTFPDTLLYARRSISVASKARSRATRLCAGRPGSSPPVAPLTSGGS